MEDLKKQDEEIEALKAIYGDEWQTEDLENRSYSILINAGKNYVKLYIKMLPNYPSNAPPNYEMSAPNLDKSTKAYLGRILDDVYLSYIGQSVIFQWIERIREELQQLDDVSLKQKEDTDSLSTNSLEEIKQSPIECPEIVHGDIITDRKSTFQGHVAVVTSEDQVQLILNKLRENKKIANATHNMYAYRIYREDKNTYIYDSEDDGESQAGGRLMRFLELIDAKNILVVVTRWYGGIHIGFDRFRHIISAARDVLIAANLMPENKIPHKGC